MSAVKTEETRYPRLALQSRHVDIQIHPVDPLKLQGDVLTQNLGNAAWYAHSRLRLAPVLRDQMPALCGHMTETDSSVSLPNRSRSIIHLRRSVRRHTPCRSEAEPR